MRTAALFTLLSAGFWFGSCQKAPDFEVEKQKLMRLHEEAKAAHLGKDAAKLVAQFDEKMVSVNRGKISANGSEAARARFQAYFDSVEFIKWEDAAPPAITFSDDATMAYMVIDKQVELSFLDENGRRSVEATHFAWVSIFKKQPGGDWKLVCNASTNEPPVTR